MMRTDRFRRSIVLGLFAFLVGGGIVPSQVVAQSTVIVEVAAGDQDQANVPVSVTLPETFRDAKALFVQRLDTAQETVVQRSVENPAAITWILQDRLARGQARRYRVIASNIAKPTTETVTCRNTERALVMSVAQRPVLTYHTAVVLPPQGLDPVFRRSGFIHPAQTPGGRVVTADFPADHAHQHGIFFAWKQSEYEGRPIDFWNQADKTGTVEHVAVNRIESGPVYSEFAVSLRHLDLTAPGEPKPALEEDWVVRLYAHRDVHVFDLKSTQRCATDSPLKLLEYHYGGMGYRGPTEWLGEDSGFAMTTSEGMDRKQGNHSRPHWVDCIGPINGTPCGLRVIQHPDNFRFPQPVRLHPSKPYFVFSPEVLGEFSIEPEEEYVSQYRYVLFDGRPSAAVDHLANGYVSPPTMSIVE